MDPDQNLRDQIAHAESILETWDEADPETGEFTQNQLDELAHDSHDLAELVVAIDAWIKRGGFSPEGWGAAPHNGGPTWTK